MNAKLPPHNLDAERSVLGGLMLNNAAFPDVAEILSADDFYRHDHQVIWRHIADLSGKRKPADLVTLPNAMREAGELEDAGGYAYVLSLSTDAMGSANIRTYAQIVREKSILRQIIAISGDAAGMAYQPDGRTIDQVLDELERGVFRIRESGMRAQSGPVDFGRLVEIAERGVEIRCNTEGGISGLRTGIADLDDKTTGLHPGDLVIVAGRPSMGKTSLAQNFAESCAIDQSKWALFFTMEMPGEQIALRAMASRNRVPLQAMRKGEMSREYWDRIGKGGLVLRNAKMLVDETPALSPNDLRARARRAAMRNPLGLIVVDYIQLMQIPGSKENRTNEISEISRSLKSLAKELHVPVVALSQLNRGVEARDNKRPRMADLRESGGIEQDADLIVFVYRDEVYNTSSPDAGTAELIIGKQRNGPLGTVRSAFLGEFCRFENLAHDWAPAQPAEKPRLVRGFGRGMSQAAHALGDDA